MQAVLYVRPLLQLRTIRAYRELAYSICCYAVVAVVVLAATASSANLTAGREDSSEHVPAVDGRLHHLDASTVSVVQAALQGSFLLPLRATTGSIYHRLSPIDPVLTLCVIDAALMLRSNRNSSNGISAAGREGSSSTFLLLSSILTYTTHTLCILLRKAALSALLRTKNVSKGS